LRNDEYATVLCDRNLGAAALVYFKLIMRWLELLLPRYRRQQSRARTAPWLSCPERLICSSQRTYILAAMPEFSNTSRYTHPANITHRLFLSYSRSFKANFRNNKHFNGFLRLLRINPEELATSSGLIYIARHLTIFSFCKRYFCHTSLAILCFVFSSSR
jgi:hypothetical protein